METFSALLAICAGNSPVTGEFPAQRPVTRSFDVFFDLHLNKRLSKNRKAGDSRRYRAHYDVIVMYFCELLITFVWYLRRIIWFISIMCILVFKLVSTLDISTSTANQLW